MKVHSLAEVRSSFFFPDSTVRLAANFMKSDTLSHPATFAASSSSSFSSGVTQRFTDLFVLLLMLAMA